MARSGKKKWFRDTFAIYYSRKDKCWIAHSLRTDEFGTGDCIIDALTDGIKAVDQVVRLACKRSDIELFRDAPDNIKAMVQRAQPLPGEMFDIAHKRVYGEWPEEDIKPAFDVDHREIFKREFREELMPA